MTDRHSGYIVVLNHDLREDDAEATINAIRQIKFVADVKPIVADLSTQIAEMRVNDKWRDALYELAKEGPDVSG